MSWKRKETPDFKDVLEKEKKPLQLVFERNVKPGIFVNIFCYL
jgi:hypothetical protein